MAVQTENKIALLIDGDNAQSKFIEGMLYESGKYGKVTIRRIYGDWTGTHLANWKEQINKFAIRPMQKFAFTKGKNSTDTAMIIDAMDILHSKVVTGFCIASSDSDYTGLAQRIREDGIFVMGIGEANKTTNAFINACDVFIFTENLNSHSEPEIKLDKSKKAVGKQKTKEVIKPKPAIPIIPVFELNPKNDLPQNKITLEPLDLKLLENAFEMVVAENGMAYMGEIGMALRKLDPSFDSRTYGCATVTNLFKKLSDVYELVYNENGTSLHIKLIKQK